MGIWGKILKGEEEHLIDWPGFVPCPPMNHQGQGSKDTAPGRQDCAVRRRMVPKESRMAFLERREPGN